MTTFGHVKVACEEVGIVADIQAQLEKAQAEYDRYVTRRNAEDWEGYDGIEAADKDGYTQGYIAALQDVLRRLQGEPWQGLIFDEGEPCHTYLGPGVRCPVCGEQG